ncbi:MAG TPA: hypothetical protein VFG50_06560 [Rhodothermales bacterium]|nr:hypothetical protein [Rhodothermales bacterium]
MTPRLAFLLSILCLCGGCATVQPTPTRTAPGFDPGKVGQVALLFTGATVTHYFQNEIDPAASTRLDSSITALTHRYLAYFGRNAGTLEETVWQNRALGRTVAQSVYDVFRQLGRGRRSVLIGLHVAPDVVGLQAYTPARYALAIQFSAWDMDAGLRAINKLPPGGPPVTLISEALLIDLSTAGVVWYTRDASSLNPRNPAHIDAQMKALLMELCTGRRLDPESFLITSEGTDVLTAIPFEGPSVSGVLKDYDGYTLSLQQKDGSVRTIGLPAVKSLRREWPTTAKLFP